MFNTTRLALIAVAASAVTTAAAVQTVHPVQHGPIAQSAAPRVAADRRGRPLAAPERGPSDRRAAEARAGHHRRVSPARPDRMMAFYRMRAGLPQKAEPYGGWDGAGRNLTGHIAGHHLSAVSLMFLATGDARFKERADYLVREMKEVQDKKATATSSALEKGTRGACGRGCRAATSARAASTSTASGRRGTRCTRPSPDCATPTVTPATTTALDVETKFAAWAEGVLKPLDDAQVAEDAQHRARRHERGARRPLRRHRRQALARPLVRFEHHAFTDALKRHQDNLNGKHGNCQIPKLIGSAARYGYAGDAGDSGRVVLLGSRRPAPQLRDGRPRPGRVLRAARSAGAARGRPHRETCNVYNMLKLTRRLFALRPDAFYADFHERALFNHVLARSIRTTGARRTWCRSAAACSRNTRTCSAELHLLRGHRHGEPRAARRRPLLRVATTPCG